MNTIEKILGNPSAVKTPRVLTWLQRSKSASLVWTAMRVWLGIMWLQAGIAKIWGAENPAFLHNGGAGVAGFAAHGAAAYSWWGTFLHGFVVPNAGWIGILVALTEFSVGVCLVSGFLTPLACLASLALLFTYVMSGTASVCAFYALFALVVLATWKTSSWIGVDGLISGFRQRRRATKLADKDAGGFGPAPQSASPATTGFRATFATAPAKERVSAMTGASTRPQNRRSSDETVVNS
jgi:thiosulfate dehydrogenase [quinone] large subunit